MQKHTPKQNECRKTGLDSQQLGVSIVSYLDNFCKRVHVGLSCLSNSRRHTHFPSIMMWLLKLL
jgi:hypothetical protein